MSRSAGSEALHKFEQNDIVKRRIAAGPLRTRRLIAGLALLVLLALTFAGCGAFEDIPQNTFDTRGQPGGDQKTMFLWAMWPALVIGIGVLLGLVVIVLRFRERDADGPPPRQLHGNTRLEIAWTLAPTFLLLGLAIPMVAMIFDVGRTPAADAFPVRVTGLQWAWQFEYPEVLDAQGNPVVSLGEVHLPVGREIGFTITATDVVHSFWVPRLAGKVDAIPTRENRMWIRIDEPGSYSGQCAEFCGLGHADMRLTLIAHDEEDFQRWMEEAGGSGTGGE